MTVGELAMEMAQKNREILRGLLSEYCPAKFGMSNSFVAVNRNGCIASCHKCWSRTEEQMQRDRLIWDDYKKSDFTKVNFDDFLKKWNID